ATARRNGRYGKLAFSLGRTQIVAPGFDLFVSMNGQYASKNLDPSEKFYLGGYYNVRAYPTNEAGGDNGASFHVQLTRHVPLQTTAAKLDCFTFYDAGFVELNKTLWAGWNSYNPSLPNSYWLQGIGAGANLTLWNRYKITASVSDRIGSNPGANQNGTDGNGTLQQISVWLGAKVSF
ncbi:MAG TPA: ShlB/FhaC/HecB family hemolysin secretion/activation protein, partial [Halothiobacillus sp.]|nr:ShlB/FhaC/HecB family hemolysin secretion/activation protein [Halothiobacillus sp.]